MKKNLLSLLLLGFFAISTAFAQKRTITGRVTGADDGQPLPGVTVKVQGSSTGALTNLDGLYTLSVPADAKALTFSYVGFETQTVTIGTKTSISLALNPDAKSLSEVVVVGYGTQEKRDLTGSVGKVSGATIADLPTPSFDKDLAGRITGVRVTESSGLLGAAPVIRIRGTNSLSGEGGPLYVVDGIPIITGNFSGLGGSAPSNALGDINSEDIESIEVLKDGSATAIYGSRASSGVILITTKKGKVGKQAVNYSAWFGQTQTSKRLSLLNAAQFMQISNEKFANTVPATAPQAFPENNPATGQPYDTNWQNVVFQKGFQENHSLSVSGATDKSNYYFSGGFSDLTGDIVGNAERKYNFRANVEQKALDIFTFGFTSTISYQLNTGFNNGTNALSGNVTAALFALPNVPVFNPDGSYNISASGATLGQGNNLIPIDNNYTNIKYVLDNNVFRTQNLTIIGTSFIDAKIFNGLNVRSQIGINSNYDEDYEYLNPVHGDGRPNGVVLQEYNPNFNYDWINTITYNRIFGNHKINVVGGAEFQKFRSHSFDAEGTGLSNTFFGPNNIISNTNSTQLIFGGITENSIRSFFGRVNYSYKDRYLLTVSYRSDYLSNLGIASKPGLLPGASLGWRVSDEGFFKEASALKFINDLKFRVGYGRTGNTNIGNYPFASTYAPAPYGAQSGINFASLGNPNLNFEETDKYDAGLDVSLFKSRITLTADYFYNKDNQLIQQVPIAPSLGVPGNIISENIGTMYNKGLEIGINSLNINTKDFTWSTAINMTFIKNQVTGLFAGQDVLNGNYNIRRVGYAVDSYYGFTYLGVNPANGNPLYRKGNGQVIQGEEKTQVYYNYDPANPTAEVTASSLSATTDKTVLGSYLPAYFGSINNTFTYKGVDLGFYFTYSGGNDIYDATRQENLLNQVFNNNGTEILNRWTTPGQITNTPRLQYGASSNTFIETSTNASTRFLEDGKYLRLQEATLGYSFPKTWVQKIKLSKLRVYGQVQNAFILTHYKGLDPEVSSTGQGVDYNSNPRPRTFVVGLNVGF